MDSIRLLHEGHSVIILFVLHLLDWDAHQQHEPQYKKCIDIAVIECLYYVPLQNISYIVVVDSFKVNPGRMQSELHHQWVI